MRERVRMAAVGLLLVWVGPVTFDQTDAWLPLRLLGAPERARATASVVPAGEAAKLEPGTRVKLRLRDGDVVRGRYLGRTLLDSARYAARFSARAGSSSPLPFALGETLQVKLKDDREWRAPFAGFGQLSLLLSGPDGSSPRRVPFEFAQEIRRADGRSVEPKDLARAFREGLLPSAEALVVEDGLLIGSEAERLAAGLHVAVEDIHSITAELPGGGNATGVVVLGVLVAVVMVIAILASMHHTTQASSSCQPYPGPIWGFAGVELSTRPFDLERGCFVGDPLAAADPWPGSLESGPATAMAVPAHAPAVLE